MKIKVINTKRNYGIMFASDHHGIPIGTIRSWERKVNTTGQFNFSDGRRNNHRPVDTTLDQNLLDYFRSFRSKHLPVTSEMLRNKAKQLSLKPYFNASPGWLSRFLKRNHISLRKKTHVIQKLKENYGEAVKKYYHPSWIKTQSHNWTGNKF